MIFDYKEKKARCLEQIKPSLWLKGRKQNKTKPEKKFLNLFAIQNSTTHFGHENLLRLVAGP
jgi:hypothetical protein